MIETKNATGKTEIERKETILYNKYNVKPRRYWGFGQSLSRGHFPEIPPLNYTKHLFCIIISKVFEVVKSRFSAFSPQ